MGQNDHDFVNRVHSTPTPSAPRSVHFRTSDRASESCKLSVAGPGSARIITEWQIPPFDPNVQPLRVALVFECDPLPRGLTYGPTGPADDGDPPARWFYVFIDFGSRKSWLQVEQTADSTKCRVENPTTVALLQRDRNLVIDVTSSWTDDEIRWTVSPEGDSNRTSRHSSSLSDLGVRALSFTLRHVFLTCSTEPEINKDLLTTAEWSFTIIPTPDPSCTVKSYDKPISWTFAIAQLVAILTIVLVFWYFTRT